MKGKNNVYLTSAMKHGGGVSSSHSCDGMIIFRVLEVLLKFIQLNCQADQCLTFQKKEIIREKSYPSRKELKLFPI